MLEKQPESSSFSQSPQKEENTSQNRNSFARAKEHQTDRDMKAISESLAQIQSQQADILSSMKMLREELSSVNRRVETLEIEFADSQKQTAQPPVNPVISTMLSEQSAKL